MVTPEPVHTDRPLLTSLSPTARRNIVICTTSITSGNKIMTTAMEKGSFGKAAAAAAVGSRPPES